MGTSSIAITGAGAAGCFCAAELGRLVPDADVTVFESGSKPLAKVAVTGGGRCNITNSFDGIKDLRGAYPHGAVLMKRALQEFSNDDILDWFRSEGVEFVLQEDNCWFPSSQDAMQIVNTLTGVCLSLGVKIVTEAPVSGILPTPGGRFTVTAGHGSGTFDRVIVTAGGWHHHFLDPLGLKIIPGVPSLFSLNINDPGLNSLMGTVVDRVRLSIAGEKISTEGTLLLSHWGISGPVTLNLSAFAARLLAAKSYRDISVSINWLDTSQDETLSLVEELRRSSGNRIIGNSRPACLAERLWAQLLNRSAIPASRRWSELGRQERNRLVNTLTNDVYAISGKCKFQPGFVTSGGISLDEVNYNTMECKKFPGLYFAGEILDIDGITGGFNLQAAWSTAHLAAKAAASSLKSEVHAGGPVI